MTDDSQRPVGEESQRSRLLRKFDESPFVPIGVLGLLWTIARQAYGYRNRGSMSTSVYLMHLRVQAQAMVVGGIAIGVTYGLVEDLLKRSRESQRINAVKQDDQHTK